MDERSPLPSRGKAGPPWQGPTRGPGTPCVQGARAGAGPRCPPRVPGQQPPCAAHGFPAYPVPSGLHRSLGSSIPVQHMASQPTPCPLGCRGPWAAASLCSTWLPSLFRGLWAAQVPGQQHPCRSTRLPSLPRGLWAAQVPGTPLASHRERHGHHAAPSSRAATGSLQVNVIWKTPRTSQEKDGDIFYHRGHVNAWHFL